MSAHQPHPTVVGTFQNSEMGSDIALPMGTLQVLWYLDHDGQPAYAYSIHGDARSHEIIGSLFRIQNEVLDMSDNSQPFES